MYYIRVATISRGLRVESILLRGTYATEEQAREACPEDTEDTRYGVVSNLRASRERLA